MRVIINMMELIQNLDNYILLIIKKYVKNRYLDRLMPVITRLGNLGAVWFMIATILLLHKPYRIIGGLVLITLAVSTIIGEGIVKHLVRRIRPFYDKNEINLLIAKPISYSFPSGHTLSSFAVAEILSTYFTKYKFIFMCIAFLIAISRIYLFVHYPTDIIAGVVIGLICSNLVLNIFQKGYFEKFLVIYKNIR